MKLKVEVALHSHLLGMTAFGRLLFVVTRIRCQGEPSRICGGENGAGYSLQPGHYSSLTSPNLQHAAKPRTKQPMW